MATWLIIRGEEMILRNERATISLSSPPPWDLITWINLILLICVLFLCLIKELQTKKRRWWIAERANDGERISIDVHGWTWNRKERVGILDNCNCNCKNKDNNTSLYFFDRLIG